METGHSHPEIASEPTPQILGVVLAGGCSKRMGKPKDELPFMHLTLAELASRKLALLCDRVVISKKKKEGNKAFPIIEDLPGYFGPLAGIVTALTLFQGEGILVLPTDAPFVSAAFLAFILRQRKNYDVVIPYHNGIYHPTIGFYRRTCLPVLARIGLGSKQPLQKLLLCSGLCMKPIDASKIIRYGDPERMLFNANTPEEYQKALQLAQS